MKSRLWTATLAIFAFVAGLFTPAFAAIRTDVSYVGSGNQDRRPKHWREVLLMLDPDLTPLTHLLLKLDKESVSDVEYNLFEDDDIPLWSRVNNSGGYAAGATSIVVDDGTVFGVNFRVLVSSGTTTGEILLVTAVVTNTLTVTRAYNGTTAAAIDDRAWFLVFGELTLEGGNIGSIRTTVPVTVTNYVEIFREPYGFTNTNAEVRKRGPNDPERDRMIAMRNVKRRMEYALRVGKKRQEGSGATTQRHTGGFEEFTTSNVFQLDGSISEPDLLFIMEKVMRYGTGEKLWLCGREARLQMDALGLAAETISAGDQRNWLGISITKIRTSFGMANLVTDHSLANGLADRIHIVDIGNTRMAVLRGLKHLTNRQGNGEDLQKNEFLSEVGLYNAQEKSHGVVKGLTYSI